jgi:folylpolyglutamate synthase/dihydropteroate synthase
VKRAATPEAIAERAGAIAASAHLEADPGKALALARRLAHGGRPVVVAGSLYLVGEVRRQLRPSGLSKC